MNYKAVLFDFDYTLGDATEAIVAGFTYAFREMGLPIPDRDSIRGTVGLMLEDAYTLLSKDEVPARRAEFRRLFAQIGHPMQLEGVPLFPGAKELILALRDWGIPTGVISSKRTDALVSILEKHGLARLMSLIIGGDKVDRPKPDPQGLLNACSFLGLKPEEVLYCGDTVIDAETARRAGACFCPVLNGVTPVDAFSSFPWEHIAPDLLELRRWLEV